MLLMVTAGWASSQWLLDWLQQQQPTNENNLGYIETNSGVKERKKNKLFNWASFEMEWNSWAVCTIQSEDGISFPFLSLLAVGIDGNGSLKNNNNNISTHTRKKERKKKRKRKHHQKWKKGEAEEECPFLLVTPNWYGHKWSGDGQTGERTGTLTIWRFSLLRCLL